MGDHRLLMETGKDQNQRKGGRHRKKLTYLKVREQMEFYFSDANLSKDRFLSQLVESDPYVPLEVFLRFNKISSMVESVDAIGKALKKSEMLELSSDGLKVKRRTPLSIKDNEDERTIYVENLAPETTHEDLTKVFSEFGKVLYVSIPKYSNTRTIKGFAFVEFDSVEEATKTVEIFQQKGSCLSSQMLPEKLCSIRTFENPDGVEKSKKVTFKFELDSNIDNQTISENDEKTSKVKVKVECKSESDSDQTDLQDSVKLEPSFSKENRLKRKRHGRDITNVSTENDTEADSKKKRKVDLDHDCEAEVKFEVQVKEEVPQSNSYVESEPLEDEQENNEAQEEKAPSKKKNRKKKKKSKCDKDLFAFGMHILPKMEWKRLRNKYLNMQRSNMKKVKQQLAEARFLKSEWYNPHQQYHEPVDEPVPTDASKARVSFTPGVIIRVGFNEPVADIKLFKSEAKSQSSVQYVDIHEGACEAYLRCASASDAQHLIQSKFWENMSVVQGNEESAYWEKIFKDREEKLSKKRPPRKHRGREKLIHRAETLLATHLHFDT